MRGNLLLCELGNVRSESGLTLPGKTGSHQTGGACKKFVLIKYLIFSQKGFSHMSIVKVDGTHFKVRSRGSVEREPSLVVLGMDNENKR